MPHVDTFTTPGGDSWVCPNGVPSIQVELWGAGAGGDPGNAGFGGAGGGGGEFTRSTGVTVTGGNTYSLYVGVGGIGGDGMAQPPVAGENSNFTGDDSSPTANGGGAPEAGVGGVGGTGGWANDAAFPGGNGADTASDVSGSGGGASGSPNGAGGNGFQGDSITIGQGGFPFDDNGAAGGTGGGTASVGEDGFVPGGGGGGGGDGASGGSGAKGKVIITYDYPTMAFDSVNPAGGSPAGGTSVTIKGGYFIPGDAYTVSFGGSSATSVVVVDFVTITCITPAHVAGLVTVTIHDPDGNAVDLTNGYAYFSTAAGGTPILRSGIIQ